ncbi:Peptidyl-prolyl cis-trans isomerase FKBP11 [Liparis tanakae]|uniref:Peptidyl-prolyl cis-trans isomerase FKBP11 n=1 Tax=Liparis tanakae TaxID=230148 RepID=A0A4Z2HL28_9TELE|nr:Peptidyl-prolyl cis-trans isomerase FKBP11 [Liparis tanakae]
MKIYVFLLLLAAFTCGLAQGQDSEPEELQVETLGKLIDGKVIDSSLSVDPLVVELGKRTVIPGDATLEFEVEVVSLTQQTSWQKMVNDVFPLVCLALVPTLLGLVGLYLYKKANAEKPSKKKAKDKKSKKK